MGRSYKDLVAWQKAMDLVTATYRATAGFPKDELFGLTSSCVGRLFRFRVISPKDRGDSLRKEFRYFLGQARGSLMEVETQLQIAENLNYLQKEQTRPFLQSGAEVGRILNGLLASISEQVDP